MNTDALTASLDDAAWRVAGMLDDWSDRLGPPPKSRRSRPRERCRLTVAAVWCGGDEGLSRAPTRVWLRNVSAVGVSFLTAEEFQDPFLILDLSTPVGTTRLRCEVTRKREVHDRFFEYGAKFVDRVGSPDESSGDRQTETAPEGDVAADNFF